MNDELQIPNENLYLYIKGETLGPFTRTEIKTKFDAKEIDRGTFLWFEGLAHWINVGDMPEYERRKKARKPPTVTTRAV